MARLYKWAEGRGILPEGQAGFREGRCCLDNIFSLSECIHARLRQQKGSAYVIFVDFNRAFDSINHTKLWNKLYGLGVSPKIIRIIANLYSRATLRVRTPEGLTRETQISEGVLQGEILSPLLFILFIADMEEVFRRKGMYGISLNSKIDVLLLKFADDLAILGRNVADVRTKLKILKQYCDDNSLKVNEAKTKILYCSRGGRKPAGVKFIYGMKELEIVDSFTYLGTTFSASGVFRKEMESAVGRARLACTSVSSLIYKAKLTNLDRIHTLYNSMVSSVLLYGCQVWSLRYIEEIECIQMGFYKGLLGLPRTTSNDLVRAEMGILCTAVDVWKLTWRWVVKILEMEGGRLPRVCFVGQVDAWRRGDRECKYNWAAQIFNFINSLDPSFIHLADTLDARVWRAAGPAILEKLIFKVKMSINNQIDRSHYLQCSDPWVLRSKMYLKMQIPLLMKKIMAQLRMANRYYAAFYFNGNLYVFDPPRVCPTCRSSLSNDSMVHFVLECPTYHNERLKLLKAISDSGLDALSMSDLSQIVATENKKIVKAIVIFVIASCKLRAKMSEPTHNLSYNNSEIGNSANSL